MVTNEVKDPVGHDPVKLLCGGGAVQPGVFPSPVYRNQNIAGNSFCGWHRKSEDVGKKVVGKKLLVAFEHVVVRAKKVVDAHDFVSF